MAEHISCLSKNDLCALRDFVLGRLKEDGGFAATPMLPHTIADTWCALEVLAVLRMVMGDRDYRSIIDHWPTKHYLSEFAAGRHALSARIKYQLVRLLKRFDLPVAHLPPVGSDAPGFRSFEELFYLSRLREKNFVLPADNEKNFFNLSLKTVRESYFYLKNIREEKIDLPLDKPVQQKMTDWLTASQNLDGGFGFYPGTTSYLENSFYGLAALDLLTAKARAPGRASLFICSCRTGAGGFGRTPSAAPFLEDSRYAMAALTVLETQDRV